MRQVTIDIYKYDELTDKAKAVAREWYSSCGTAFEYQQALQNVKEDAENIGLKITYLHDDRHETSVSFIDGAFNCANKILSDHGDECATYIHAKEFMAKWDALPETNTEDARVDDADAMEGEFLQTLLSDYRKMYDADCQRIQSDEYVAEQITANEYEFTLDGKRFVEGRI